MDIRDLITRTRDLISDHHRWTRYWYARNNKGQEVGANSKHACRWCANGALWHVARDTEIYMQACYRLQAVSHDLYGLSFVRVNDELGRKAVLKVLDAALDDLT